jgi:ornithine lipid ester-linked acyl 2-hydroxylase
MSVEFGARVDRSPALAAPLGHPAVTTNGIIAGAPAPGAPLRAEPGRPLLIRVGKHLRGVFDSLIARGSLVPNEPVLDVRHFPWTQALRDNWRDILEEAREVAMQGEAAPSLATISPDHRSIAEVNKWRSFFLWGYGYRIDENADRCPVTSALVERIPGLNSAFFSILAPGTHIPDHRGVTKGLITCHLGLIVPRDGDVRMRVHDRVVRWAEGETLVFDDTYRHEVWNETSGTRVVLLIQFERPLRGPAKWIADAFLGVVKRSAFVQEARDNIGRWNAALKALDG